MIITFIGSGNVATVLGRRLIQAGHTIEQVFSRTPANAETLADELAAEPITSLSHISSSAQLYIVCLSDRALENLHTDLQLGDRLVAHTAGSVPLDVLQHVSTNYGVLYPLQTIRKELPAFTELPIFVDGNHEANRSRLASFARSFSGTVGFANDEQRSKLHLAAVVANNFSNYLFGLAADYCKKEGIEFRFLLPLLHETVNRLELFSPVEVQTGPAVRGDENTIRKHLDMLAEYPELRDVYERMSNEIARRGW